MFELIEIEVVATKEASKERYQSFREDPSTKGPSLFLSGSLTLWFYFLCHSNLFYRALLSGRFGLSNCLLYPLFEWASSLQKIFLEEICFIICLMRNTIIYFVYRCSQFIFTLFLLDLSTIIYFYQSGSRLGGQTCRRSDQQRVVGDNSLTMQFTNEV